MEFIELRSGPIVPFAALQLAVDLEARGHALTAHDDALHVTRGGALTAEDRQAIARWKRHLLAIVEYVAPSAE